MLSPVSSTSTKLQVYAFYFVCFPYCFLSLDNSSKSAQEDSYVQGSEILADQVQQYFSQPLFRQSLKLQVKLYPNFEAFLAKGQGRQDCFFPQWTSHASCPSISSSSTLASSCWLSVIPVRGEEFIKILPGSLAPREYFLLIRE